MVGRGADLQKVDTTLFCHSFRDMLKNSGVKPVRLPPRSPNLNATQNAGKGVQQFVDRYHQERDHQSLGNKLIEPMNHNAANSGRVLRRQRLGGVLIYYYRDAG